MGELNISSYSHGSVNMNVSTGASVSAGSSQRIEDSSEDDQADTTVQHMILKELQPVNTCFDAIKDQVTSSSSKHSLDRHRDSKLSSSSGSVKYS